MGGLGCQSAEWWPPQSWAGPEPPLPEVLPQPASSTACPGLHMGPADWLLLGQTKTSRRLGTHLPLPPELSFMSSAHSSYNLDCFSVLEISPKETYDPGVT